MLVCVCLCRKWLISSYSFAFMNISYLSKMRIAAFTWVFLVPLLAFLVCVDVISVPAQSRCQIDQRVLLLQLKGELNFEQSERLKKWDSSTDCCNWAGVKCDDGGHVIGLNLSKESISGGIGNSSLFSLKYLQNLDLSFNNFTTTLPATFGYLTELRYMNLSNAGFSGQIPIQISQLTRLENLDLSILYFPGMGTLKLENPSLAKLIQNFTYLRELHLDGVNITAQGNEWCQALSSLLPNLQVLSMSKCFLSGPFHPSFALLKSLTIIRLGGNNLAASVPEYFGNFSNLTELSLSFCELQGAFPESIFHIPKLEILDLSINKLLKGSLPNYLGSNALKILLLSNTKFAGTLPMSIANLQNLSRIELANCNFDGPIPSTTENLSHLSYLDFSFNNFSGSLPSFHMARNLVHVDLSYNQLVGEISSTNWEVLQSLKHVDFRYNRLNGSIPSSLFTVQSLQKILLSYNELQGQVPNFTNVPSLDTVDLSSNKLEGFLPKSLFHLQKLSVLSFSSNNLSGTIKLQWIQQLSNLTTLDLSYNNLTVDAGFSSSTSAYLPIRALKLASCNMREFPLLIRQAKLFSLDLSDNLLEGVVPSWIWEDGNGSLLYLNLSYNRLVSLERSPLLSSLSMLDLSNNNLRGNIPDPPSNASFVDYSNNNFTSSIPSNIGINLNFTMFFSLANNYLKGGIPETICSAGYLQVLDLSHNNLDGAIPPCFTEKIGSLGVLNLRRNQLSGTIPDQFPAGCELKTLDLSGNHLWGNIPKSLANCSMLEVLNLGNNQIKDTFPCHLKNTTLTLRVLILRNNKFYGTIGCPGNYGTWPDLQIVDIASNNFSGELPARCLFTWEAMMREGNQYDHLKFKAFELTPGTYYQDSIIVTLKGLQMELQKILTVFTSIDFSSNNIGGPIPDVIGAFSALYVLNMSFNALNNQIPSSFSNLLQLESLDLSFNNLSGPMPPELSKLNFLSVLNLSYNQLSGPIPTGNQLQTFDEYSFIGNEKLCGQPLEIKCNDNNKTELNPHKTPGYDLEFIVPGIGFGLGAAMTMAPLMVSKKANKWCDDQIEKILPVLLPVFGLLYYTKTDWRRYPDGISENNKSDSDDDDDYDEDDSEDDQDEEGYQGRYCVYCTKLDITRKRVIHDGKCTCYYSPLLSAAASFYCSSSSPP